MRWINFYKMPFLLFNKKEKRKEKSVNGNTKICSNIYIYIYIVETRLKR